ncbi:TPA: MATE family efflux transporter [Clostridioides difficile]|uniref:Multidrug export protein MepA n=4 Tax=Clostridioides difficile TaxID=1496 RepID=Q188A6_CLOD6|nr:MATE family efflux transporter [Clostridioides difficile]EQF64885.1 MATE efflux family protein [Clostridioides difficile CD196]OFU35502.1 MATE family efflux transporter [Clostridium sp. HMSC19B04]OFU48417.1 MATE family efflux transporter [Clostridium sp. HMSC19A11]AJP11773.1 putative drug / sodium antiporter, MATE family [Clostridioides difficile 630]ARE62953.1 putative drug / sodium antiporter, MATE family [Clostridioides difficile]
MIQLSDNFNYKRLLKFTFPTIIMLVISSIYGVVDGYFVSNFVGKTAFTAVNFIMPFLLILGCVGFLFGTGGGALIAKTMGEGKKEEANEQFSLLIVTSAGCGIILAVLGIVTMPWIASAMGADGQLLTDSILYGCVVIIAIPAYILQCEFQCLFATAEKPKLGLYVAIMAGITNIVLDALFITVFKWGLVGAALATAIGQYVGGIIPLLYFSRQNNSLLKFKKPKFDCDVLKKTVANGSSELMTNVSTSVVSMLYNAQLLKYAGEDGVASYGVLLYVALLFQAVFIGYSVGTAPIISYHYGAKNYDELKNLRKRSLIVIICFAVFMFIIGEFLSKPIAFIFVGYDNNLMEMTLRAFMIYSFSFLFSGFGVFGSSFFTALNDGLTSALIAFMRILVFQVVSVLIFPIFWGVNGIWFSIVGAEILATIMTAFFIIKKQKKYHY